MKFALVYGERKEAAQALLGNCPGCGASMIARCGEHRVAHWAHRGKRVCDPWWENETEWHRNWKANFPVDSQEVIHRAENGEIHIADVKTNSGRILEFQHSYLNPEERRSRNSFYKKLVWVVDASRRLRDTPKLFGLLGDNRPINRNPLVASPYFSYESALIRDWCNTTAPVFFDISEDNLMWCLIPSSQEKESFLSPIARAEFIEMLQDDNEKFDQWIGIREQIVSKRKSDTKASINSRNPNQSPMHGNRGGRDILDVLAFAQRRRRSFRF